MLKYKLSEKDNIKIHGKKLKRILACRDFSNVKEGDFGGYIESEDNLSHDGNAWIFDNSCVFNNAKISDDACVFGSAWIFENAEIYQNAKIYDSSCIYGNARVFGEASVLDNANIFENAEIYGNAQICDSARICSNADIKNSNDIIYIKGIGKKNKSVTIYKTKLNIGICCYYFSGEINQFCSKMGGFYEFDSGIDEYYLCINLARNHFSNL